MSTAIAALTANRRKRSWRKKRKRKKKPACPRPGRRQSSKWRKWFRFLLDPRAEAEEAVHVSPQPRRKPPRKNQPRKLRKRRRPKRNQQRRLLRRDRRRKRPRKRAPRRKSAAELWSAGVLARVTREQIKMKAAASAAASHLASEIETTNRPLLQLRGHTPHCGR